MSIGVFTMLLLFLPALVFGATTTDGTLPKPYIPPNPILYSDLPIITDVPITTYKGLFEDLTLRTTNSLTYFDRSNGVFISKFYPTSIFREPVYTSIWDYFVSPVYALSTSTPVGVGDGRVDQGNSTSWDLAHTTDPGGAVYPTIDETNICFAGKEGASYYIYRGFLPFDTSSLPDDATIATSSLFLYVSAISDNDNDGLDYIGVVQTTQADPTTLTTADFDQCGAVDNPNTGSVKDLGAVVDDAYNEWVLDATGRGWVSLTGWTYLGVREGHDIEDTAVDAFNGLQVRFSEYTGTTYDPYLEITYTTGGGSNTSTATTTDATGVNEVTLGLLLGILIIIMFDLMARKSKNL